MELRWSAVLAVPVLLAGLVFGLRAGRALLSPGTIVAEVTADSALNVGAAFAYMVIALVFQLTLVALVVSRLVVELRRSSRYDALTGLLNRRAVQEELENEVQRSRRLGEPFSVLMLDADHFKGINDVQGHAAGDRALQHLGTLLSAQMRDIDRVGRWGGEEFVVLLPGSTLAQAQEVAERLRERAQALPPRWQDRALPLTLSAGLSQWAGAADELRRAARAGRRGALPRQGRRAQPRGVRAAARHGARDRGALNGNRPLIPVRVERHSKSRERLAVRGRACVKTRLGSPRLKQLHRGGCAWAIHRRRAAKPGDAAAAVPGRLHRRGQPGACGRRLRRRA